MLDSGIAYTNTTRSYRARAFRVDGDGDVVIGGTSGTVYPALGDLTRTFVAAPDLGPATRFVAPRDFIWDTDVPVDLSGHGTHVAGTIGQTTNNNTGGAGVAFDVKLMPVKVIDTEWPGIYDAIGQELRSQYVIGYVPTGRVADVGFRHVSVGVVDSRAGLARTRAGYYANPVRSSAGASSAVYRRQVRACQGTHCSRLHTFRPGFA